jgi:hypothetical protein
MARKTVLVSDLSGKEIETGKHAVLRVTYDDARKSSQEMDLRADEVDELLNGKARSVARRGRRPKSAG